MKIYSSLFILTVMGAITLGEFQPSSTSAVSLIGGVVKARHEISEDSKYPRDECPVCEGKGWYISGDGIEKVECGYCEPKKQEAIQEEHIDEPELVTIPEEEPKTFILRRN
jgi:hypothetical protein